MKKLIVGIWLACVLSVASVAIWSQTKHQATVSWTYTQGTDPAVGFNVGRATVSGGPYITVNTTLIPIATLSFVDTSVAAGDTYFYVVNAQDMNGILSANSAQVQAVIPGNPTVPGGVTVVVK